MGLHTKEGTLSKLDKEIAEMEALMSAGQEEQVLDGTDAIAPEGSTEGLAESTDQAELEVIVPEDTLKPIESEELGKLRKELADEKHRFARYKGSTDNTVYKLRKDLAAMTDENVNLKKQLAEVSVSAQQGPDTLDAAFNQDVIDILGEDAVDAIKSTVRTAQEKADNLEKKLTDRDLQSDVDKAQKLRDDNVADFMAELQRLVPDVAEMDGDPEFNDWLRQPGPDGVERLLRLRTLQDGFDAVGVAGFFKEYKQSVASAPVQDTVSNHIGPTGTQSGSSNQIVDESQRGFVKQSEINEFTLAVRKGSYKYDPAKAEAMEAKIFKAMSEGKILMDANPI